MTNLPKKEVIQTTKIKLIIFLCTWCWFQQLLWAGGSWKPVTWHITVTVDFMHDHSKCTKFELYMDGCRGSCLQRTFLFSVYWSLSNQLTWNKVSWMSNPCSLHLVTSNPKQSPMNQMKAWTMTFTYIRKVHDHPDYHMLLKTHPWLKKGPTSFVQPPDQSSEGMYPPKNGKKGGGWVILPVTYVFCM